MKPILYFILALLGSLPLSSTLTGQKEEGDRYRVYTTQEYTNGMRQVDTTFRTAGKSLAVQSELVEYQRDFTPDELTVLVVFHVLYSDKAERITEDQVVKQLRILNEDFASANLPTEDDRDIDGLFRQLATDTRIRFCRAAVNPDGRATSAINYRQLDQQLANVTTSFIKEEMYGAAPWNPEQYLNIWITPLDNNVAGYAQAPGTLGATDGIVINSRFFGVGGNTSAPFDGGRTLTHLVGSYLGLSELWNSDGCGDDGVEDTPVHNSPNFGKPGVGHISTCDGFPLEMTMNFMDNTDDDVQYMFTRGQATRMRSVLLPGGLRSALPNTQIQCASEVVIAAAFIQQPAITKAPDNVSVDNPVEPSVEISPNPAKVYAQLSVSFGKDEGEAKAMVYDAKGSIVTSVLISSEQDRSQEIYVGGWTPGTYLVRVDFVGHQITRRLIVQ